MISLMESIFKIFILSIFLLPSYYFSQTSYKEALESGEANITVKYRPLELFVTESNNALSGIEGEIFMYFIDWLKATKGIDVTLNIEQASSFSGLYNDVKESEDNTFGLCAFSITQDRLTEVNFSPAYFPDIEVLISGDLLPTITSVNILPETFKKATVYTVEGSTFDLNFLYRYPVFSSLKKEYVGTTKEVYDAVAENPYGLGFVELLTYFNYMQAGHGSNRQDLFLVRRDGYGIIYPKGSDWHPVVWEFFQQEETKSIVKSTVKKYLGQDWFEFVSALKDYSEDEQKLVISSKEKSYLAKENAEKGTQLLVEKQAKNQLSEDNARLESISDYLIYFLAALLLVVLTIFLAYKRKAKDHKIITAQKAQVEEQKKVIEDKHRLITDSINYAKTIQNSMLNSEEEKLNVLPEHFVFFEPKDVVSGDFYWSKVQEDYIYMAAVDCTGHGVPGGFMSVLGMSLLNDILSDFPKICPAEICEKLSARVIKELDQSSDFGSSRDGMDLSLLKINMKTLDLTWAGANNPLYIFRKGELIEFKPNKQPIGFYEYKKPFVNKEFKLEVNDMLYVSTDGYPDQFGGERNKKLKSSGFKNLLQLIHPLNLPEQKKYLEKHFVEWKGDNYQIDDACVIGIRIK